MPTSFILKCIWGIPGTPPQITVTQELSSKRIRGGFAQDLWDSAQDALGEFKGLEIAPASLYVRIETGSRDHSRSYCTVKALDAFVRYTYKFYCGVGEWVATTLPGPQTRDMEVLPEDFYGRKGLPVGLGTFWGLNGLLGHTWYPSHRNHCKSGHYDVLLKILPAGADATNTRELLALCESKNMTHVQVCADAKLAALFQVLIGVETSARLQNLSHCLTQVFEPCGQVELGKEWLFEDAVRSGVTMKDTGWFESVACCALVSNKHPLLPSKCRRAALCKEFEMPY